jgi:hypothetical protein
MDYIPLDIFHIPSNQEIRSKQKIYLTLLLGVSRIPNIEQLKDTRIGKIFGLRYFTDNFTFLTEDNYMRFSDYKEFYDDISKYMVTFDCENVFFDPIDLIKDAGSRSAN